MHTHNHYEDLIQREKDLHGDVEILHDVVYWPIILSEAQAKPLGQTRQKILRFVKNGYNEPEALLKRLDEPTFAEDLEWLIQQNLLTSHEEANGRVVFSASQSSLPLDTSAATDVYDAVSNNKVEFPLGTVFLQTQDLVQTIPILAGKGFIPNPKAQHYVECLLMLIFSTRTKARATRVYCKQEEIAYLQEMLYDFVLDESECLANTRLAAQAVAGPVATRLKPIVAPKQISAPKLEEKAAIIAAPKKELPLVKPPSKTITKPERKKLVVTKPQVTTAKSGKSAKSEVPVQQQTVPAVIPASMPRIKIISGRAQHEEALEEAFRSARQQIIIVTPFIRARLIDRDFRSQLALALQGGVNVTVIHGMPNRGAEDFDDTPHENWRIRDLARSLGRCQSRLRFVRVTGEGNSSAAGEHSKILVCDGRWAVVTSFNWLSFPETNETGVWVEDQESVADLLRLFSGYIEQATTGEETRQEIQAAWPTSTMSKRQWNEWHYGDYNSQ